MNDALYKALERSWEIAWNEWLPAFDMKRDSFNSYPHLRNLENYLEQILFIFPDRQPPRLRIKLSAPEIYLLLSAVLFHDIGKIRVLKKKAQEEQGHAEISGSIISTHWSSLGIISSEMAVSLAKICKFHDLNEEKRQEHELKLHTTFIDPYGEVREHSVASLLLLADHLDGAYTRVLPYYLRSLDELEIPGLFRRIVRGVFADHDARMIKTVLSTGRENDIFSSLNIDFDNFSFAYGDKNKTEFTALLKKIYNQTNKKIPFCDRTQKRDLKKIYDSGDFKNLAKNNAFKKKLLKFICGEIMRLQPDMDLRWKKPQDCLDQDLLAHLPLVIQYCGTEPGAQDAHENILNPLILLLFLKFLNVDKEPAGDKIQEWPAQILLVTLLRDVRDNAAALRVIKNNLIALGLPFHAWVIDFNEHLYNIFGMETFEPVFQREYLIDVAKGMWQLSTSVFGKSFFSYANLADEIRESDLTRIKMAVRRLSIIINDKKKEDESRGSGVILAGDFNWKWIVAEKSEDNPDLPYCRTKYLQDIILEIKKLGDPDIKI